MKYFCVEFYKFLPLKYYFFFSSFRLQKNKKSIKGKLLSRIYSWNLCEKVKYEKLFPGYHGIGDIVSYYSKACHKRSIPLVSIIQIFIHQKKGNDKTVCFLYTYKTLTITTYALSSRHKTWERRHLDVVMTSRCHDNVQTTSL